jgi:hypothetical protein
MDFRLPLPRQGRAKQVTVEKLEEFGIPFVDVGMGVELVDDSLICVLRVTSSTRAKGRTSAARLESPSPAAGRTLLRAPRDALRLDRFRDDRP